MKKIKHYKPLNQVIFFSQGKINNLDTLISKGILEEFEIKRNGSNIGNVNVKELDSVLSLMNKFYEYNLIKNEYNFITRIFLYEEKDLLLPAMICNGIVYKINNNFSKISYYTKEMNFFLWLIERSNDLSALINEHCYFLNSNNKKIAKKALKNQLITSGRLEMLINNIYKAYCKEFQIYPIP